MIRRPGPCPGASGSGPHLTGGCRCLVNAAPTHALIRSLVAIGWSPVRQAELAGYRTGSRHVHFVLTRPRIQRVTALRLAELHTRLWDIPGSSVRSVTHAARHGWSAPDPVTVARLVAGIDCDHTTADRDQAVRVLASRPGNTPSAIAERLHMAYRTVRAILAESLAVAA